MLAVEVDRKLSHGTSSGAITISTKDLKEGAQYSPDVKVFAYHKKHCPFQRRFFMGEVNRELVSLWERVLIAHQNGQDVSDMTPLGQLALGTLDSKTISASDQFCIVDGQQRLGALKRASINLGYDAEVTLPAIFFEGMGVPELAAEFVKLNMRNDMYRKDFIAASVIKGDLCRFREKLDKAIGDGHLYGISVGIRPTKSRSLQNHEIDISDFLGVLFSALVGDDNKVMMVKNADYVSQEAVNRVCRMLSMFQEIIGHKQLRKGKSALNTYSSVVYLTALARLALVMGFDDEITEDGWRFFLELHTDIVEGKGFDIYEFASSHSSGGKQAALENYSAWTDTPCDSVKNVDARGVPVARPNKQYRYVYAPMEMGYSKKQRPYFEAGAPFLKK